MVKRLIVKKRKKLVAELTQDIPASGIITVGNDASATIELKDDKIAPEQLVIVCENQSMTLLCRVAGTKVNGRAMPQGALHELRFGDEIALDGYTLVPADENGEVLAYEAPAPPMPADSPEAVDRSDKSLSDVLENLRAEEKFYFMIESPAAPPRRFYVDSDELALGWDENGNCVVASAEDAPETVRADLKKDWSGVVITPRRPGNVKVNQDTPDGARRLKNDDVIVLLGRDGQRLDLDTRVRFHEPTALLLLDSILPKELPPPISLDDTAADVGAAEIDDSDLIHSSKVPALKKGAPRRNIFGFFTITEIIIMTIGTLITAAIIFLVLEYF